MDSSPAQHRGKAVPLRALIVDDCKYTRQLVRLILVNNLSVGEVTEADGAEHALMQLRGVHRDRFPHVVILDCEMPGMRGPQLATAIRTGRDLLNPSVPIVMLTTRADAATVCEARDAGINEYVVKPVVGMRLLDRINRALHSQPRFVREASYCGPDRRRRVNDVSDERRHG